MTKIKSDIEIARTSKMKPIGDVLKKFDIPDDPLSFSPMGRHIAKLNFEYINKLKSIFETPSAHHQHPIKTPSRHHQNTMKTPS